MKNFFLFISREKECRNVEGYAFFYFGNFWQFLAIFKNYFTFCEIELEMCNFTFMKK